MKTILAIDTSSEACSASLLIENTVETRFEIAPQAHSELLLSMCNDLLAHADLSLSAIDGIAFSRGPGSFTGLRIGAGVVQGLAYAQDIPVACISSLDALALFALNHHPDSAILACIDARMGEVYWQTYLSNAASNLEAQGDEQLSGPENLNWSPGRSLVGIGTGMPLILDTELCTLNSENFDHIYSKQLVSAEEIALLAANYTNQNEWLSADQVAPVYLRNNVVHQR